MSPSTPDSEATADPDSVARMREHWRAFAREDAMYYVATNRADWSPAEFYAMAKAFVEDVLEWAGDGIGRRRMVEIGCGAGRMLVHLAPAFERVDGVDIAPEMLEAAQRQGLPGNVHLTVGSGADLRPLEDASADLVLAREVFQHIPDRDVIASYVAETARVLRPGGRAVLHFDTRAPSLLRRALMVLPDRLLPRKRRRYIRRYPVPADWARRLAADAGLDLIDERFPSSEHHLLLLQRG